MGNEKARLAMHQRSRAEQRVRQATGVASTFMGRFSRTVPLLPLVASSSSWNAALFWGSSFLFLQSSRHP